LRLERLGQGDTISKFFADMVLDLIVDVAIREHATRSFKIIEYQLIFEQLFQTVRKRVTLFLVEHCWIISVGSVQHVHHLGSEVLNVPKGNNGAVDDGRDKIAVFRRGTTNQASGNQQKEN
jgi:hypothetical protein